LEELAAVDGERAHFNQKRVCRLLGLGRSSASRSLADALESVT
jgi:hypothetical protein